MKNNLIFSGGGNAYISPTLELHDFRLERGFAATLPGISTEEGEGWGEY